MSTYYKTGSWNAICDVCGVQYKSDDLRKRWDGLRVCKNDFETRHPQSLLRLRNEDNSVPFIRKMADTYITQVCDIWTSAPLADIGVAECATVGSTTTLDLLISIFYCGTRADLAEADKAIIGII